MAKAAPELTVTQSLIERLIDKDPSSSSDPAVSRPQSVRQLKASLRRDLEWLLNTRRNPEAAPESMAELSRSLYNYGLPDFSALSVDSPQDRSSLVVELENTVALFEPRLKDIRVSLVENPSASSTRTLHFQIEGMLDMDPSPEQISFDTVLQLSSGEYQIRGERGA
ncbi:MAG TPA: type VI secretion system baseplate subunit TssE [Bryobacteraceae bacterium]|nr:type VI secretion system baseplate subunit TssE [Bryobacteraceae bacterium]